MLSNLTLAKAIAFCAHMVASAHCHVWVRDEYVPINYIKSVQINWDINLHPDVGLSPCLRFKGKVLTWWNGKTLFIRTVDGNGYIEADEKCVILFETLYLNGGTFKLKEPIHFR